MLDVISIGSATLDIFLKSSQFHLAKVGEMTALCERFNEKIDVEQAEICSGGGATNTAVGFARMGLRAACVAEIGKDFAGNVVMQDLLREGVDVSMMITEKSEETAIASLLISENGARTALVFRGASRLLTIDDIPWNKLQARWIHLSSVGNTDLIREIFKHCRNRNIRLSWNPGNWEIEAVRNRELLVDWEALEMLFVNKEEMEDLLGNQHMLPNIKTIIITNGKDGGEYITKQGRTAYSSVSVPVVQETGAGDAFACGVVSGLLWNKSLEEAIEYGKKNSSSVIQKMGAKKGLLTIKLMKDTT